MRSSDIFHDSARHSLRDFERLALQRLANLSHYIRAITDIMNYESSKRYSLSKSSYLFNGQMELIVAFTAVSDLVTRNGLAMALRSTVHLFPLLRMTDTSLTVT